jgi:catechol 2,3-dioxygenase-like lactoylglutathione lyase family enzyme
MQLLRAATLLTPDPDVAAARYAELLGYEAIERGAVSADLAASWGAPACAGRRYVVCRPASGVEIYLRFVEGKPPADYRPLRTYGWAATELCVRDVLAVNARLAGSAFEVIGPPKPLDGLPMIFPMQVRGPDQEIVFLTQILDEIPGFDLPRAQSLVDHPFIMVLACSNLEASNRWLASALKLQAGDPLDLAYEVLSDAFDLPPEHKHRIATLTHGRDIFLETDQYPAEAGPRARAPGDLPPGVALVTLIHPEFDSLTGPWITPPALRDGVLYGGRRAGVMTGPDGVLVEVVEAG